MGPNCNDLKIRAPPKIKHFLWQIVSGGFAVTSGLIQRGISCDNICKRCGATEETINHVLFGCPHSRQTWTLSMIPFIFI